MSKKQRKTTLEKREKLSVNQCAFLAAFAQCGTVTYAALAAKVDRTRHYAWFRNEAYSEAFKVAQAAAAENLEHEARKRACEGIEEDVRYRGEVVGTVKRYSDILLIFLLKAALPAKYGDRRELTGLGGAPLIPPVEDPGREKLTDADLDKLIAIAESTSK